MYVLYIEIEGDLKHGTVTPSGDMDMDNDKYERKEHFELAYGNKSDDDNNDNNDNNKSNVNYNEYGNKKASIDSYVVEEEKQIKKAKKQSFSDVYIGSENNFMTIGDAFSFSDNRNKNDNILLGIDEQDEQKQEILPKNNANGNTNEFWE